MRDLDRIEEQAVHWLMRREDPAFSDEEAFERWIEESPAHKAAFWRLEYAWSKLDRARALPEPAETVEPARLRRLMPFAVVVALAASVVIMIGTLNWQPPEAVTRPYHTAVGQQGTFALADGSKVELNTDTNVRVSQDLNRREIWLDRGETYLEIARDPKRPFVVNIGDRKVTVLGTKFVVSRQGDLVTVAVVEGRVRFDSATSDKNHGVEIVRGDIVTADQESTLIVSNALPQIERRLRWRSGMISLEGATLADAVAQFNRYHQRKIVIRDPRAANLRIGGSFKIANVTAFVRLLREAYGLRVEILEDEIEIS